MTLIGKLIHWPQGSQVQRAGREKVGQGQQDKTPPGVQALGLWEAGLSQERPLGPKTDEKISAPSP